MSELGAHMRAIDNVPLHAPLMVQRAKIVSVLRVELTGEATAA